MVIITTVVQKFVFIASLLAKTWFLSTILLDLTASCNQSSEQRGKKEKPPHEKFNYKTST